MQRRSNNTELKWKIEKRLLSFESAQFLLALAEQSALGTFSSLLPPDLAALLRSAVFFFGAVFFARMTLARSAFHGFQIGFKRCTRVCTTCRSRPREPFHASTSYLLANIGVDTAENGPLKVCQQRAKALEKENIPHIGR